MEFQSIFGWVLVVIGTAKAVSSLFALIAIIERPTRSNSKNSRKDRHSRDYATNFTPSEDQGS